MKMNENGNTWDVTRHIPLSKALQNGEAVVLIQALQALRGVSSVTVGKGNRQIRVVYDASKVDYRTLSLALEESGFTQAQGWWNRLKVKLYAYSDANARDNAEAPPPACCNKPPK